MPDALAIAFKLKQQRKFIGFRRIRLLNEHLRPVKRFVQDVRAEGVRHKCHLQVSAIAVIGNRAIVYHAIRVKRLVAALCTQAHADRTRDCCRVFISVSGRAIRSCCGHLRIVHVFQIEFYLVGHG